jgi:hypothetical protein
MLVPRLTLNRTGPSERLAGGPSAYPGPEWAPVIMVDTDHPATPFGPLFDCLVCLAVFATAVDFLSQKLGEHGIESAHLIPDLSTGESCPSFTPCSLTHTHTHTPTPPMAGTRYPLKTKETRGRKSSLMYHFVDPPSTACSNLVIPDSSRSSRQRFTTFVEPFVAFVTSAVDGA